TALSLAAENGHEAVVKLLLGIDQVNANSKDRYNQTALSLAAKNGHKAVVKLLLKMDQVDANSKDNYNRTALSLAAENGHEAVVKLLLGMDQVDANSKDRYNQTALSLAAENGHKAVVKLLLNRQEDYVKVTGEVVRAVAGNARSGVELMELLLDRRGDEVKMTEEVVKAVAGNSRSGVELMELLLDRRGDEVKITEEVVKAVEGNSGSGVELMELLLLGRRRDEVNMTEEMVKAVAENSRSASHGTPLQWQVHQDAMPASHLWVVTGPSGTGKSRVGKCIHDELGLVFVEGDDFLNVDEKASILANGYSGVPTDLIKEAIGAARECGVVVACSALRRADRHAWRDAVSSANSSDPPPDESPPLGPENSEGPDLHNIQDTNFQGVQRPRRGVPGPYQFPDLIDIHPLQDVASQDPPDLPTPPLDLSSAATATPTIHLHFIYLDISEEISLDTVRTRQARSGHFMSESAVEAHFSVVQPPQEEETDCRVVPRVRAEPPMPIVRRILA
ncbi:hypothetical protein V494_00328, partial [Pseudogymnoascus sp. VKM F-4513 (FW-928)]